MKQKGFQKGQTHPQKDQSKTSEEKSKSLFRQWLQKAFSFHPTGWEQRMSIWVTVVFTFITGYFAWMSYNTQMDIKGMKEVLATFKPNVRAFPTSTSIKGDTCFLWSNLKNNGTRMATDIIAQAFLATETKMFYAKDSFPNIAPQESFAMNAMFNSEIFTEAVLAKSVFVLKILYKDPADNTYDSSKQFTGNLTSRSTPQVFSVIPINQRQPIIDRIRVNHPDF